MAIFKGGRAGLGAETDRARGDVARDRLDWSAAERAYKSHLDSHDADASIWVQYGHALKEQNKGEAAVRAYRRAVSLRPDDSDAETHLGHLLKSLGRKADARSVFASLFERTGSQEAYIELAGLPGGKDALQEIDGSQGDSVQKDAIFFELDDMFGYLEAHKTLSGIQRVQACVIKHVLQERQITKDRRHQFVLSMSGSQSLWEIRDADLAELIDYVTAHNVDHQQLKDLISLARRNSVSIMPVKGQTLFILGSFWGGEGVGARYFHFKKKGVVIGAYLYDIIPITHYEFCDQRLSHDFSLSFGDALHVFDFFVTISDFTASEVQRYWRDHEMKPKPIASVPLAHASSDVVSKSHDAWSSNISFLKDRPFVLMVSTVEGRKNHSYLVSAWKSFLDEGLDPPDLVFVGRTGWRIDTLLDLLKSTDYFDRRIHILNDLSDAELNTLYFACLYTAFPSFVEGWGLPVGESLAHGKPCVASSTSSIPEVGRDFVDYLDPFNLRDGIEVLRKMTFDAAYRKDRMSNIERNFKPRRWSDVGRNLLATIDDMIPDPEEEIEVSFSSGVLFRIGDLTFGNRLPRNYAKNPIRLMLTDGWYAIESGCCWIRERRATITFKTELVEGTSCLLYLKFVGTPWATDNQMKISVGKPASKAALNDTLTRIKPGAHFMRRVRGVVGEAGIIALNISISGPITMPEGSNDTRVFALGLVSIGYTAESDLATRVEFQDKILEDLY